MYTSIILCKIVCFFNVCVSVSVKDNSKMKLKKYGSQSGY